MVYFVDPNAEISEFNAASDIDNATEPVQCKIVTVDNNVNQSGSEDLFSNILHKSWIIPQQEFSVATKTAFLLGKGAVGIVFR